MIRLVNLLSTAFKSDRNSSKSSGAFIFCKCPIFKDWFFAFKLSHSFSLISLAAFASGSVQRSKSNSVRLLVVRSNSLADFLRLSSSLCFFWSLVFALKWYQSVIYWNLFIKELLANSCFWQTTILKQACIKINQIVWPFPKIRGACWFNPKVKQLSLL